MRVVVFGASGMLGHMAMRVLALDPRYEVFGAIRGALDRFPQLSGYREHIVDYVDVSDDAGVARILESLAPAAVINAVAVRPAGLTPSMTPDFVRANALWPHQLANLAEWLNIRLCHISSDGVFSGRRGDYSEDDRPDPEDIYGASKLVGEPVGRHVVNLRTSIIGPELNDGGGLLSWLLRQNDSITGFSRWLYSGLTTLELAKVIRDHVLPDPRLEGIYHVAGEPISKFELLRLLAKFYDHDVVIEEDAGIDRNRTLNAGRFSRSTGYRPPNWAAMISELRQFGSL